MPQHKSKKRIAIIGAGISGLSSAFFLHEDFDVTVYEKNDYLGGHTDTHTFTIDGKNVRIDSGFIIFCPEYYPHFSSMLNDLGVESQPTVMSFSARNHVTDTIYNATTPNKLFCDRRNLLRPKFWRMVFDIVRFYHSAKKLLQQEPDLSITTGDYLKNHGYSVQFSEDHLLPMMSALWSATPDKVKGFPIYYIVDFFQRHGLLKLVGRPQWLVIKNGSASYVEALKESLDCHWKIGDGVTKITRSGDQATVTSVRGTEDYDAVIMATHADVSLKILGDASVLEKEILGDLKFETNHVLVHTDESMMHPNKLSWASWNTVVPRAEDQSSLQCCTANYWMNSLQGLDLKTNVFTTLNSTSQVDPDKVLAERFYEHPIFTVESVAAQKRLPEINGVNRTFHVGAFWGWASHEDGARSAHNAAELIKHQLLDATLPVESNEAAAA